MSEIPGSGGKEESQAKSKPCRKILKFVCHLLKGVTRFDQKLREKICPSERGLKNEIKGEDGPPLLR
jgi:hypothetical protein